MLKKLLLAAVSLVVSWNLFSLLFLQWSGLGLGNNLDEIQTVLLWSTLLLLPVSLVASFFGSVGGVASALLLAILCFTTSLYWASGAKERKDAAIQQSFIDHNQFALDNALSTLACDNGDTAVLYPSTHKEGSRTTHALQVEMLSGDMTKKARHLAMSIGRSPPDPDRIADYLAWNPGIQCNGDRHSSLHELFEEVARHYRRERPGYYPGDPLYAGADARTGLGATPVDPLDLLLRIQTVNQDLQDRAASWESYSIEVRNHKFDKNGNLQRIDVASIDGNSHEVIWHDPAVSFKRAEVLQDGHLHAYLDTGSNVRKVTFEHVLHAQLRGELRVAGHQDQGILAWHEPVQHEGRSAHRYKFHSTTVSTFEDWMRVFEFIIDDETGLVLLTSVTRNGQAEQLQECRILGPAPGDLHDRVQAMMETARRVKKG